MEDRGLTKHEIVLRGKQIYEEKLRPQMERDHLGKFIVVDVRSEDYEVGIDDIDASLRILERRPDAVLYGVRIGDSVAYRFGRGRVRAN